MEQLIKYGWDAERIPSYDCWNSTRQYGHTNHLLGIFSVIYGLSAEFLYTIALLILTRKEQRRLSCYKIMISLGAYDMVAIAINSIASGYLWLSGANYCTDPTAIYALGCLGVGTLFQSKVPYFKQEPRPFEDG
ncbi:unnamed protein product [Cylicocyclus nassatus]|uniref:Uncharacterized protein n=1 Tax=Cylicocyclus nassatus TaxID=53992 RepID=A0AA36MCM9_CYLNA|nr:unnamed protein product [Cylicocyclus nassatus]